MIQILCFLLPPTIALFLFLLIKKEKTLSIFTFIRWVFYAISIYFLTAYFLVPINRATVRIAHWGREILYLQFGSTAMLFAFVLAFFVGLLSPQIERWLSLQEKPDCQRIRRSKAVDILFHTIVLVCLFLTFSFIWALSNYGTITFNEIVFHLSFSLQGTSRELIFSFLESALLPSIAAFLLFELLTHISIRRTYQIYSQRFPFIWLQVFPCKTSLHIGLIGIAAWFAFLLVCADQCFQIFDYAISQIRTSSLIEEEYVDPLSVQITFPEQKRNLITIYIESGETSSQDLENGGFFHTNYIPEMTRIAKENISFSHSQKLEGAAVAPACGWTIAGLVAQSSGLPLKMPFHESWSYEDSDLQNLNWFMPGATSLGDLLAENGYRNVFMAGSDFAFGGRLHYYTQHGQYVILDYGRALESGVIPSDYYANWGFDDRYLYEWAKEELIALSQSDQPFHLAMLTADTHMPNGYQCPLCPNTYENSFENILACSSAQLDEFLTWCKTQPFYENTSIVITGDHASMVTGFYGNYASDAEKGSIQRKIYNAFIGSSVTPLKENNRLFTTLDFFPTTLASIGVTIEGDRLGLGTNLFSARPTLAEEYGYDELFRELNLKSKFFDKEILHL